ncbi:MAG: FIG007959: peptidase, M16 family [uncultured Solirubrobacteraceae bacterium]|uniref:FIG007959: peptidase, M16 family n=1 Tax=uncultured Solirubrobacteraceae bacterium TaxID=1162706 RepID=A0A6J4SF08_9ACTN|nr:MAG: FIG007959: peptidase, M16 family [uncultured Solirubrobacteraceae bacterium]
MGQPHELTTLDSGVRVVTEAMPSVRSAALGLWIGTGSAAESHAEAGLSHLIEHMLFRGTDRYESLEIDQLFDGWGAELNAGTGKETTSVHARVLDRHVAEAFDVMADMVFRPRFDAGDLEAEREIVLEEIAMYDDDPQDKVFDVLGEAVFGDHPLGRAIIGRAEVVAGTPAAGLAAFHAGRYVPGNVVVAAAGSVDHAMIVALTREAEARTAAPSAAPPADDSVPGLERRVRFITKETEQYHVALGGPGVVRDDPRRFALRVLDNILGGTSSSRLFQEVREKRGLAYSVFSFTSNYARSGQVGLYVGTRPDNVAKAMTVVGEELERFRQSGATAEELDRSRENVKGRILLGLESTTARMNRLGSSVLAGMPLLTVDELEERIDAVTRTDVEALARELYAPERLSAAGVGADESAFRSALVPIAA